MIPVDPVKKVVIVGGVADGMSATTWLRRRSEATQIVVFDRGPYVSIANCGLPYHLGGEIADRDKLIVQFPNGSGPCSTWTCRRTPR